MICDVDNRRSPNVHLSLSFSSSARIPIVYSKALFELSLPTAPFDLTNCQSWTVSPGTCIELGQQKRIRKS